MVDFEAVSLADQIAMNRTLGIVERAGITEVVNVTRFFPSVGMSRPFIYDQGWRDIINKIEVTVEKRYQFPEEVVWEMSDTRSIYPGDELVVRVNTDDPFINAQTPVVGVKSYSGDQQIVTPPVYDLLLESGQIDLVISRTSGQSLDIIIKSIDPSLPAVITGLQLRAQPVRVVFKQYASGKDTESQTIEGIKTPASEEEQPSPFANLNDSKALIEVILNQRFKKLPYISFSVKNGSTSRLRAMLDLRLSDRALITEDETFTDDAFYIESIKHSISGAGTLHETVIGCEQIPTPIPNAFTFDDPTLGFDVGTFGDRSNSAIYDDRLFILGQSSLDGDKVLGL